MKIIIIIIINLLNVDLRRRNCPSAANTISTYVGILNGGSDLINDLLDLDIFTKQIRNLKTFYSVVRWLTFRLNCGFRSVKIFAINFITRIFCAVYATVVRN